MKLGQVVEYLIAMILIKYSIQKFGLDTNFIPLYFLNRKKYGVERQSMFKYSDVFVTISKFFAWCLKRIIDFVENRFFRTSRELWAFICFWIEFFIKISVIKCCSWLLVFDRKCILYCMSIKYETLSNSVFKNINKIQSIKIIKIQMVLNSLSLLQVFKSPHSLSVF